MLLVVLRGFSIPCCAADAYGSTRFMWSLVNTWAENKAKKDKGSKSSKSNRGFLKGVSNLWDLSLGSYHIDLGVRAQIDNFAIWLEVAKQNTGGGTLGMRLLLLSLGALLLRFLSSSPHDLHDFWKRCFPI